MRAEEADANPVDRYHLCYALGKAYEDWSEYAESWQFYERGNALKRAESSYRPKVTERNTRKQIEVCTAEFFSARAGVGAPDPDPIDFDGHGTHVADIIAGTGRGGRPMANIIAGNGTTLGTFNVFDPTFLGGIFVGG